MKVMVTVKGCDDSTSVVKEVSEDQLSFLKQLATEVTEASEYACMPTMEIVENPKEEKEE